MDAVQVPCSRGTWQYFGIDQIRDYCLPNHNKPITCFQNGDGCPWLVGPWGQWVYWPNSPQWPSTLVQAILRDSVKKMIIRSRWMVWLLSYHSSLTDERDFLCATDHLRTQCVGIIHGKGRENGEPELLSLSSPPSCCRDGVCLNPRPGMGSRIKPAGRGGG